MQKYTKEMYDQEHLNITQAIFKEITSKIESLETSVEPEHKESSGWSKAKNRSKKNK